VAPRTRVNVFLALFLPLLLIDGFRGFKDRDEGGGPVEDKVDWLMDTTGLWQGPWKLFGPDVDKVNLRMSATIDFADGAVATWTSPDWPQIGGLEKFVKSRRTNYFANSLTAGKEPAWDGLAAYLARTTPHPQGKAVAVTGVTLLLRGAEIPPPDAPNAPPPGPYLAFDEPQPIYHWAPKP
jgi:hypothetical protein